MFNDLYTMHFYWSTHTWSTMGIFLSGGGMVGFMEALKLQQFTAIDQNMLKDLQKTQGHDTLMFYRKLNTLYLLDRRSNFEGQRC